MTKMILHVFWPLKSLPLLPINGPGLLLVLAFTSTVNKLPSTTGRLTPTSSTENGSTTTKR